MVPANNGQLKSSTILEEIKRRQRSRAIVDVEEEWIKVVIFTCGGQYAFYGCDIREILPACDISWVPGLPDYLPGLINLRGDIESVVDIRYFLGEGENVPGNSLVAIAVRGDFHSGVLIDTVEDVVDIPQSAIRPPLGTLSGAARELVCGELEYKGKTLPLLDIGKLESLIAL